MAQLLRRWQSYLLNPDLGEDLRITQPARCGHGQNPSPFPSTVPCLQMSWRFVLFLLVLLLGLRLNKTQWDVIWGFTGNILFPHKIASSSRDVCSKLLSNQVWPSEQWGWWFFPERSGWSTHPFFPKTSQDPDPPSQSGEPQEFTTSRAKYKVDKNKRGWQFQTDIKWAPKEP